MVTMQRVNMTNSTLYDSSSLNPPTNSLNRNSIPVSLKEITRGSVGGRLKGNAQEVPQICYSQRELIVAKLLANRSFGFLVSYTKL
jgi:hypothetical protein